MSEEATPIATHEFWAEPKEGEAFPLHLTIFQPAEVEPGHWQCRQLLQPLYQGALTADGSSSFEALTFAVSLAFDLLDGFTSKGGRLRYAQGAEEVDLGLYTFGRASSRKP
jgi:hypothetical protein